MRQSMCIIVVWGYGLWRPRGGDALTRSLSVQKNEKITRTVPILKSNSIYIYIFFSTMDINFFTYGEAEGQAMRGQGALSVQKN